MTNFDNPASHFDPSDIPDWRHPKIGSKQWGRIEDDFKLEYMDLDEFLTENNLPNEKEPDELQRDDQKQYRTQIPISQHHQPSHFQVVCDLQDQQPSAPGIIQTPTVPKSNSPHPETMSNSNELAFTKMERNCSTDHQILHHLPSVASLSSFSSSYRLSTHEIDLVSQDQPTSSNCDRVVEKAEPTESDEEDDDEEEDEGSVMSGYFKSRSLRKKEKQMVSESSKDDKYWERRRKNNLAAKRSRDARRAKENQVAVRATVLERENKLLMQELRKAQAENHLLKERLCKYEVVQLN